MLCQVYRLAMPQMRRSHLNFMQMLMQVLDFLLIMDIILQFFRAYVNKKSVLVVQLSRIRRNYLGNAAVTHHAMITDR